jgi:hypothetical protein
MAPPAKRPRFFIENIVDHLFDHTTTIAEEEEDDRRRRLSPRVLLPTVVPQMGEGSSKSPPAAKKPEDYIERLGGGSKFNQKYHQLQWDSRFMIKVGFCYKV